MADLFADVSRLAGNGLYVVATLAALRFARTVYRDIYPLLVDIAASLRKLARRDDPPPTPEGLPDATSSPAPRARLPRAPRRRSRGLVLAPARGPRLRRLRGQRRRWGRPLRRRPRLTRSGPARTLRSTGTAQRW